MQIASKILCLHALTFVMALGLFHHKDKLNAYLDPFRLKDMTIGFVPTMGALHQGHLSLVNKALGQNDIVILSIFVNPTQFDNTDDLTKYPRTLDNDVELLKTLNKSVIVYAPSPEDVYSDNITSESFSFGGLEYEMEGAFRAGHFDGVGTVVKRLFDIVKPIRAYFGEKDFQQLQIIKKLVDIYKIPIEIVDCEIHRAEDGLAMSSRNTRLTSNQRAAAPFIYKTLKSAKEKFGTKSAKQITEWVEASYKKQPLLRLEYFMIADAETLKPIKRKSKNKTYRAFVAVYAGDIRLIDNIALN